jgi:hypothetical protein
MHHKYLVIVGAIAAIGVACNPSIPYTPPPGTYGGPAAQIVALFNPAATPPVVPIPTDLATNPDSGLLNIPLPPNASPADTQFAAYLNTLDGYPSDTPGTAAFSGALNSTTVTSNSVQVLDITTSTFSTVSVSAAFVSSTLSIGIPPPAANWTPGHTYAVVLVGGANAKGLQGANGETVVGSLTWFLVGQATSLVTGCTTLDPTVCQPATNLIPNAADAVQLEQLRLHYKPVLDFVTAGGVNRDDIVLAWTFKVDDLTTVVFEPAATPPQVPTPNDLAINPDSGLVNAPVDPNSPPAEQEFTTDYLNTLNGFPASAPASASVVGVASADGGLLNPSTVTASSVLVTDLTGAGDGGAGAAAKISYDPVANAINITPTVAWQKGHQYAVAIVTHTDTAVPTPVTGATGGSVVGTDVWALARSSATLVTCTNLTDPTCASALTLVSLSPSQAVQLETLRRGYSPILDALQAQGINRGDVAALWTFTIESFPIATFDLANGIVPFPNDLLLANPMTSTQHVNLPIPDGGPLQALFEGLDTLDGFSTTAPTVSVYGAPVGPIDVGQIDPGTLTDGGTGFVKVLPAAGIQPDVTVCLSCASSPLADGGPQPIPQLQFVPNVPLAEETIYAPYITTGVKDTEGHPVMASLYFALIRLKNPLVDSKGHSTVTGVSDAQAPLLEEVRSALQPLMSNFVSNGLPRAQISLTWPYTTQSTVSQLVSLHGVPAAIGKTALPSTPVFAVDVTAQVKAGLGALPSSHIGKIFYGEISEPFLLTGPGGTINPAAPQIQHIPFILTEPSITQSPPPAAGYPVVIFGHGLTRSEWDVLALADSLAAGGYAAISTDVVWHGDRSVCVGAGAYLSAVLGTTVPDDAACATGGVCDETATSPTFGRCIAGTGVTPNTCNPSGAAPSTPPGDVACYFAGQGRCVPTSATTGNCEGSYFMTLNASGTPVPAVATAPAISGWNILNLTNFFATRDNFRQQVPDLAQLATVVADKTTAGNLGQVAGAQGGGILDGTKINYSGQSLGGILGTLYNAVAPETHHVVLNVPGGGLPDILLTSPAFAGEKNAFLAGLAAEGVVPGTANYDFFINIARWVLDPADPVNASFSLMHGTDSVTLPSDRQVQILYIDQDQVVPNPTTLALIGAANNSESPEATPVAVCKFTASVTTMPANPPFTMGLPLADRHGFLLNFDNPTVTAAAQTDLVTFIATGTASCPTTMF